MTSLQNSPTLFHNSFPQKHATSRSSKRDAISFIVKASHEPSASSTGFLSQGKLTHDKDALCKLLYRPGRRQVIAIGTTAPLVFLFNQNSYSFAAENKKGFLHVLDKKDGYSFLYPFGWQEVVIEGEDKVFKDVIEPLESVSVNMIPTGKLDIKEFGPPEQVAETLVKKVLAPPNQKTKIIEAKEVNFTP
ncbi:psbP-like protein 1, chloroplastic isoform X3 [Abrus precatorius]|uniref:PsbP-like protein 1, chloroplastic isoform X3 n=1 Tax=Abrus precatorius TaxID=3816 RepID=A0A8B8L6H3_ABRPR|nr:psbP-like protein 1, chloroplastic isoform X3 [Abrus precatorius]